MTRRQEFLQRACQELGLRVVIPFELLLRDGVKINAQALLPQLGAPKGMLIVQHFSDLQGRTDELAAEGYGYSVLGEPKSHTDYDLEVHIDMFSDWGWAVQTEDKPMWMK